MAKKKTTKSAKKTAGATTRASVTKRSSMPPKVSSSQNVRSRSFQPRNSMIDELNAQYIKTVEAKGLSTFRIVGVHAMRNAAVPVLTLVAWEFIRILSGYTVVVETVFAWPGLGLVALQAIQRQDLVLLQAIVFVIAVMVVVFNLAVDMVYKAIDPRIKLD